MDASILAKFPDDDGALGPFLGNLPPDILDVVVQKLGWFQSTFAMAGKTCREAVQRVPSARAVLTEEEREGLRAPEITPLAVAVMEGDVEAIEWLIQLCRGKGVEWKGFGVTITGRGVERRYIYDGMKLSCFAAGRGKIESLKCLRANGCRMDEETCTAAAGEGHLKVLKWLHRNGCPWSEQTWNVARRNCRPYLIKRGCPGAE